MLGNFKEISQHKANLKVTKMTLKNYIYKNLWLQVVISLGIGLGFGLVLGDDIGIGLEDENCGFCRIIPEDSCKHIS